MVASGLNLVTTVIGFGMSATFIVFVCARLICGRPRAADVDGGLPRGFDFDLEFQPEPGRLAGATGHAWNGLEPIVVGAIPTMKYDSSAFHSTEDAQCSICLADYTEREILRIMPACQHNFHLACIDVWLQKHTTCPICRMSLRGTPVGKSAAATGVNVPEAGIHPLDAVNQRNLHLLPVQGVQVEGRGSSFDSDDSSSISQEILEGAF